MEELPEIIQIGNRILHHLFSIAIGSKLAVSTNFANKLLVNPVLRVKREPDQVQYMDVAIGLFFAVLRK